jgi:hypothetical protein
MRSWSRSGSTLERSESSTECSSSCWSSLNPSACRGSGPRACRHRRQDRPRQHGWRRSRLRRGGRRPQARGHEPGQDHCRLSHRAISLPCLTMRLECRLTVIRRRRRWAPARRDVATSRPAGGPRATARPTAVATIDRGAAPWAAPSQRCPNVTMPPPRGRAAAGYAWGQRPALRRRKATTTLRRLCARRVWHDDRRRRRTDADCAVGA